MTIGNTPGPGQYDSHKSNASRPRTAGGVIGVRTKSCIEAIPSTSRNVGPGAYSFSYDILNEGFSKVKNTGFGK